MGSLPLYQTHTKFHKPSKFQWTNASSTFSYTLVSEPQVGFEIAEHVELAAVAEASEPVEAGEPSQLSPLRFAVRSSPLCEDLHANVSGIPSLSLPSRVSREPNDPLPAS